MRRVVFTGAGVFDGRERHLGAVLVVEQGRVAAILPESEAPEGERVELAGGILAPGFLDLQANGGGGVMLGEATGADAIRQICDAHARLGTTGLLPTLISDRPATTRAVLDAGRAAAVDGVPGFLGLHLEGPHISVRRRGAHHSGLIRPMTPADLDLLVDAAQDLPRLMVTLAPEVVGLDQIEALARAGVVVSLGHSEATFAEARAAIDAGARSVTHLFNAMSPLGHREPGLVGAALDAGELVIGLIADGVHVAPEVIRIAVAAKRGGIDTICLVSDAMPVAGTGLERFTLNGREVLRRGGRLTLQDGTLAGADYTLPEGLTRLQQACGVGLETALGAVTRTPARLLGRDDLGRLRPGAPADMVLLDEEGGCRAVWRGGVQIH